MSKTYGQAIDDCIEVLSQMYEKYQKGAIYNAEIKEALLKLKKEEFERTITPYMDIWNILGKAKVDSKIICDVIEVVKKIEDSKEFSPEDVADKDFAITMSAECFMRKSLEEFARYYNNPDVTNPYYKDWYLTREVKVIFDHLGVESNKEVVL